MVEISGLVIPLRSLWPTLHCRRVAEVSPLMSIGWWCLSLVSPKRHCYRVCAADKGYRVYPLDSHPDAVALYSGCTPGKSRVRLLSVDRHTASLVGLRGGWRHARTKFCFTLMDTMLLCPGKGLVLPNHNIDQIATHTRFLLISLPNNDMSELSPFAIHKTLIRIETKTRSLTTPNNFAAVSTEIQPLVPLPESVPTTSNSEHSNAPEIQKPRKAAPTEITTDDEDMITYDVVEEEELEQDPPNKFTPLTKIL
ncbi:uncharacterized protein TNCV_2255921 [Trichonephila clavipes]|nr:uncharacterized protein TNCV_2255921 [Trichonephila clavipes]